MNITRNQIADAAKKAVGDPTVGPVAAALPAIIDAIDALANPKNIKQQDKEQRIIKAEETRSNEDK